MTVVRSRFDADIEKTLPGTKRDVEAPFQGRARASRVKLKLKPADWVSHFVKVKNADTGTVEPMEFSKRRYLIRPYNTPSRRQLLMTSRQSEKSSTIGSKIFARCGMRSLHTALFVTPSAMQTKVFSTARLDDIIDISPMLRSLTHPSLIQNLLEKEFVNRSKIYLRYAFLSADRIRGLSVNDLFVDELQDILQDLLPVIEETTSHHLDPLFCYSGTPKSFDNTIEKYWSRHSTQSEWTIPCERHGTPKNPSTWHWVVLGIKNIGKFGPICELCGGPLNPDHPMANWVQMNPGAQIEGFRICRLMVPWYAGIPKQWARLLEDMERFPLAQFMNEVMAISWDSGEKPLTKFDLMKCCDDNYSNDEEATALLAQTQTLYAGIDWTGGGTSGNSFTLLTIGGYVRSDAGFQILFAKRFFGAESEPDVQVKEIIRLLKRFRIKFVGVDFGGGLFPNKDLTNEFGAAKIHPFHYMGRLTGKIVYKRDIHRYLVFRSPVMTDIVQAIRKQKIRFFKWSQFKSPFGDDMMALRTEYNETMKMIQYLKTPGIPDDAFHSVLYCFLASMLDQPRPDIMTPLQDNSSPEAQARADEERLREEFEAMAPSHIDADIGGRNY